MPCKLVRPGAALFLNLRTMMSVFRKLLSALMMSVLFASSTLAAELLMMEEIGCPWCDKWKEEIGVIYHKTDEGKRAPLKMLDMHAKIPEKYRFVGNVSFSPTFILISEGREIGRIRGYPGEDWFFPMLQNLLVKMDKTDNKKSLKIN